MGLCADRTLAGFSRLHGELTAEASAERPVLAGPCGGRRRLPPHRVATRWRARRGHTVLDGEDLDLALRIGSAGWNTAAAPDAVAVHHGSATAGHRSAWQRFEGGFARGYLLRRYRILKTAAGPRALATEAIVVVGDAILSRDLSALRGRRAGWHAAAGAASKPQPPQAAIDTGIGFRESIRLRREAYAEYSAARNLLVLRATDGLGTQDPHGRLTDMLATEALGPLGTTARYLVIEPSCVLDHVVSTKALVDPRPREAPKCRIASPRR